MMLPHPIGGAALQSPMRPAYYDENGQPGPSWRAVRQAVAEYAGGLEQQGVGSGDVIAVEIAVEVGAALEGVLRLFTTTWVGATAFPYTPGVEAGERLEWAGARAVNWTRGAASTEPLLPTDAPLLRILTSGTTGTPSVVDLSAGQLMTSAMGAMIRLGHHLDDRWLCCLPLIHIGGLSILMRAAWAATAVELHPGFDVPAVAEGCRRCTLLSLTPSMLRALLDAEIAPGRLRAVLVGGGPLSTELRDRAWAQGWPVCPTWGMSESAAHLCTRAPTDRRSSPDCGPPHVFARVEADAAGALQAHGAVVRGRLATRDLGTIDSLGRVTVSGRSDRLILSGGANIDPVQIEARLEAHPAVTSAAVVPRPDPKWGQRPVAFVVSASPPFALGLRAWCRARLAPHKTPDVFYRIDALPRSALGKVRLGVLISAARLGQSRDLKAGPDHPVEVDLRAVGGLEGLGIDEGVHQPHRAPQGPIVGPFDAIAEGDRPGRTGLDGDGEPQPVAQAHGPLEVRVGVHERGAELTRLDGALDAAEGHAEQLLITDVGVVEGAREERDPDPVDVSEAHGQLGLKRQNRVLQG